jgi:Ca2+-binding RTX toxin-like protein
MKKKVILIAVVSALLLVLTAGLALAVNKTCQQDPCGLGTTADDNLFERNGATASDFIQGLAGRDLADASEEGGAGDADNLRGNAGDDVLITYDLDTLDTTVGGAGNDVCIVDTGEAGNATCERVETRP